MQVQRDVQFFESRPERQIPGIIQIDDIVRAPDLGKSVYVNAFKA